MTKSKSRWVQIDLVMPAPEDMRRGMELATKFEDRHGGHPPMFFSTHSGVNTIVIVVFTRKSNYMLKKLIRDFGFATVTLLAGSGNWCKVHLYRAAVHLSDQQPDAVRDHIHHLVRMLSYNYIQEARLYTDCADMAFGVSNLRMPNT